MSVDRESAIRKRLEQLSPQQRAALLQKVDRARQQAAGRAPAELRYPLSQVQRRLWMLAQLGDEANAAYNIASAWYFAEGLDQQRLLHAWRQVLDDNEVLRSAFSEHADQLFQTPRKASTWQLDTRRLAAHTEPQAQLAQLAAAEAARPFDLQHDWLVRVICCESAAGEQAHTVGLIVVIHHIVCDGLSIVQLVAELAQHYPDLAPQAAGASASPAASAALQYRDYVEYEARADTSRARAYWKDIFASAPETLDALLDLPRPAVRDFRGGLVELTLTKPEVAAFEALCHAQRVTLYMGLVALVQVLLARMANTTEATLGAPVAGRPNAQFGKVVGPFVNTVALRQSIARDSSFEDLLLQVKRRILEGFEHQGLAFDALVTELGFARDPSRSPLYDVMIGFNDSAGMALVFGTSTGQPIRLALAHSKLDLTFHFERETDGSLRLDLEYATAVFVESSIARLAHSLRLLFVGIPQQSALALDHFALQSAEERRVLLEDINATATAYPQSSLSAAFRRSVQAAPTAIAVHAGDLQLTYRELDEASEQLAQWLRRHPAHHSACRIALMLEKDARALIVILAIVKSGAVYVPIAANTPLERVAWIIDAGAVDLLFAETARMAELAAVATALVDTDTLLRDGEAYEASVLPESQARRAPGSAQQGATDLLAPAYLMFTSGSTGKPKGTLIEQRAVLRLVCNTDYHQVRANERVLLTGSLAFDAATFEIWGALLNGGCVCIPAGTTLLEVHEFEALVSHYQVATAFLTTGLFNQLVDHSVAAFAKLQTVLTGGEKISVEHVGRLLQAHPALKLLHVYGPTENTTFSTWHRISTEDLALATIPIGRPIANSRIYLLDARMEPVPIGMPGEIYCGGDGVALGYVAAQDPRAPDTAAVFSADPFLPAGKGRLYRTGDLAKWNAKRELVFLGRNDRQVKVRGFRVELGEVEYHLRALPGVADAFVLARGEAGSSELLAWLITPGTRHTVATLRAALGGVVPNYMLPAKVVCLERFPLNASGKVDVKALPSPEESTAVDVSPEQALQGEVELALGRLYGRVLGLPDSAALGLDRNANFFSLGGDSIRAIQLVALARSAGYHFTLKDIFATDTLAALAASVRVTATAAPEVLLRSGPLSPVQCWWLDQAGMPANHFNLSSVFKVDASLDLACLRAALDELVELHPALRLALDAAGRLQRIREEADYVLRVLAEGQSRQQLWRELQQCIDLDAGVLLAVGVAPADTGTYLAVVVHHIAADEISGRLFSENLARLYLRQLGRLCGTAATNTPEPLREACGSINWAAQLKTCVEQGGMDQDLDYWTSTVARGRAIVARQQALFAAGPQSRAEVAQTLAPELTRKLLDLGQALLRLTPQELLLAAFVRAWQCSLGQQGCVVTLEGHGREAFEGVSDSTSTLGWFTSLYPFVVDPGEVPHLDLYRSIKDQVRQVPAKGFTHLPLRYYKDAAVQEALALRPLLSFNYLGESADSAAAWLQMTNESAGADHGADLPEPFKLDVLARINAGHLELLLRGEPPHANLSISALGAAWVAELEALSARLHAIAADHNCEQPLLSLSDSLVPFAALADLDQALAALQLPAVAIEEVLPLTGMQAGMWLHCAAQPSAYQDQVALRLQQPLDAARFAAAVAALVAETQALRSGFAQTANGELLQVVLRQRTGNYQYLDAGQWNADAATELPRLRATLRARPRDLLHDPLFSLTLVRLHESCFELIIDFHHMAIDGWTSALLLERLQAHYFGAGEPGDGRAPLGMRPYFQWLAKQTATQARAYWQALLGDYHGRIDVPAHLPRIAAGEPLPIFVESRIGTDLHRRLLAWCERHGVPLNAAVQSLWGVFLSRHTGSDDLVFGATVSGRDVELAGVERIAGMLINTLPLRIDTSAAATFAELARHTMQQFAQSMAFGHLPLADIQTLAPARAGLITHTLVFENYPVSTSTAAGGWEWETAAIFDPMHFGFGLIVAPLQDDLSIRFVADGNLYLSAKLQVMAQELQTLLGTLLNDELALRDVLAGSGAGVAKAWSISANFTADSLVGMLQYHEYIRGTSCDVTLLPYDQSVQELINPHARLRRRPALHHVVLWRPVTDPAGGVIKPTSFEQLEQLSAALATYAHACAGSRLYVVICPWFNCDWTLYREFAAYTKGALANLRNAELVNLESLDAEYALAQSCHPPELVFGDIPYTEPLFAALASRLMRCRDLQRRAPVKVYVVDADDTLWGGVVGEDGVQGIRLEPAHILLQEKLVNARAAGALLCVATKNNLDDVRAVFEQREMPLRWTHLTRVCASWGPKSASIQALAADLSLGLDSFVFIDDSPLECAEVLGACPGAVALRIPPAAERGGYLNHLWLLDAKAATREDAARAQMYAEELQRVGARSSTGSYADFLAALDICATLHTPTQADVVRLAQLSQRTNQFNTRGVRYTEAEIATLLNSAGIDVRAVTVSDKYGDYGLAGSIFIDREAQAGAWTVFAFMLSCRVLGRGVEHALLRQLAQEAEQQGASELRIDFVKLARNAPAQQFLQEIVQAPATEVPGQAAQQFVLPVASAQQWQPGQSEVASSTGAAQNPGTAVQTTDAAAADVDAGRLALGLSAYYGWLASSMQSGSAIVHEQSRHGGVQHRGSAARGATRTPLQTPTELMLGELFAELLQASDIAREDSFYELGGHSLKAMMLLSRITARFGTNLDYQDLHANPRVAELAARIDTAVTDDIGEASAALPLLSAVPEAPSYRLSPGQARLWMLENLRADGPSPFHMHATLTVAGAIDRAALDLALQALGTRHEILRTSFREDAQGSVRQWVAAFDAGDFAVHWFEYPLDEVELDGLAQAHSRVAFDLRQAPLLRVAAAELTTGATALFITLHHIISDGWSIGIMARELSELYQACSAGAVPAVADAPARGIEFRDFASWQLNWLDAPAGARAIAFWREHFAQPVEALQLPARAGRPQLMQSAGASVQVDIAAEVWRAFTRHVAALGCSEFSGLFAALQLVLARLAGQQNFCIGTAVAGREHPALESVQGFFVNVLPLRSTLDLAASAETFVLAVGAEVNACLSHQSVPFDTIVAALELPRDPSRTPLFDVLLVLQNTDEQELRFGTHCARVHPLASSTSQYDLSINAFPAADGSLKLIAEYATSIYSAANIELILRCIARALAGLTNQRNTSLAAIAWLPDHDCAQVRSFEGSEIDSRPELLPDIFHRVAPHARGRISDTETDWSYTDLTEEVSRIASLLRAARLQLGALPVGRQTHVGVIGARSVRSIAALLGAMEAGAVYIPLDLANPPARLLMIIEEGAVDILLSTDAGGAALAMELQQRRAGLVHVRATDVADAPSIIPEPLPAAAIAYMIFTSGSTGKPKGVQISHAAFAAMLAQQISAFDVRSDDVCGQFAALTFDASLSEVFLALGTGASLAIAPDAARSDIDTFMLWLRARAISVITLPPVFLRALGKRELGTLRVLVTAGEAAIAEDMRHYAAALTVINAYGPTETAVCASTYTVDRHDSWPFGVPIGKPLPGVSLTVRNSDFARVPVGVTGELYIGGPTLGSGYYGAPELTAQKYCRIPAESQQHRWYRSGDLVRWREDGLLEFLGRADTQLKVRGYRIEPGEIEHAARAVAGVRDASVLVHPELGLLLYCVCDLASASAATELRSRISAHLSTVLPRHMLPGDVLLLEAFPLSASGKIDRAALCASASGREIQFVAPATPLETVLAHVWCQVLNAERVGRHADFFALGGDSIKALEVLNALRARGYTCTLRDFFASPQLANMALALTSWQDSDSFNTPVSGRIELLPVQRWFLGSRDSAAASHFHIVTELKVPERVTEAVLKDLLSALAGHHDSLRARFYRQADGWVQEIQQTLNVDAALCVHRQRGIDARADERSALEALACRPFVLDTGPLFRCVLVQAADGSSQSVVLALHHLIADWVSLRILVADLNSLAQAAMRGPKQQHSLAPPHLLALVAQTRAKEFSQQMAVPAAQPLQQSRTPHWLDACTRAAGIVDALALNCGVHSELQTLHLQIGPAELVKLRERLRKNSAGLAIELRLQDVVLAAVVGEFAALLDVAELPILVEGHGRDGDTLDLARQVAWLTRARLLTLRPALFSGGDAPVVAQRALQSLQQCAEPDVFAMLAAETSPRHTLPALLSFNYLGEFTNSHAADATFSLMDTVFGGAMAQASPVDVPLHLELYVVNYALEVQVAWSPGAFAPAAVKTWWDRVQHRILCC